MTLKEFTLPSKKRNNKQEDARRDWTQVVFRGVPSTTESQAGEISA